ncbi:MAG TPA: hypothetical protein VH054_00370, partial [Polyangiaceae bacterium]|nr:hypothetical protein [Polyangiaceae bacterium]
MSEKDGFPPENDTSDRTVLHLKKRSEPPPPSVAGEAGPTSLRTRTDESPIEPFDDIEMLVGEMRKPASERIEDQGLVASGGMGAVHLVVDKAIGRKMAMKTMH